MATSQMEWKNRGNGKVRNMAALSNLAMIAKDMEWKIQNIGNAGNPILCH